MEEIFYAIFVSHHFLLNIAQSFITFLYAFLMTSAGVSGSIISTWEERVGEEEEGEKGEGRGRERKERGEGGSERRRGRGRRGKREGGEKGRGRKRWEGGETEKGREDGGEEVLVGPTF